MSNIGAVAPDAKGVLFGWISTLSFDREIGLRPVERRSPLGPLYDIMAKNDAGRWIAVGAFWERTSELTARVYLSGKIDAPELQAPLYIAAFRQDDGSHAIAWNRTDSAAGGMGKRASRSDQAEDNRPERFGGGAAMNGTLDDGLGESTAPDAWRQEELVAA